MSAIKYRSEIDGLRAVAVLPVIIFHLGFSWMDGGFAGVDVFFVISGFLITSIILREHSAGKFSFKDFWLRRIRRILPVMFTVLAVTCIAGWFILYGPQWESLGKQVLSVIFLCSNLLMWKLTGDYWGPAAEEAPLLHCWSLSIEEQFYLFHPILLVALLTYAKKWLLPITVLLTVISFSVCVWGSVATPTATFYLLPTRAWELAAGCIVAIYMFGDGTKERSFQPFSNALAFVGLSMIFAGYVLVSETGFPGFQALIPVVGTALFLSNAGQQGGLATRLCSHPVMVYVGKISYSLYLWHWPVIVFGNELMVRTESSIIPICVWLLIPLLSVLSYHLVEQPTRRSKNAVPIAGVGFIGCVALAFCLLWTPWSYDFSNFRTTVSYSGKFDLAPRPSRSSSRPGIEQGAKRESNQGSWYKQDGWRNDLERTPEVVLFGSSHGMMWGQVVAECCNELGTSVAMFTVRAVPPLVTIPPNPLASNIFSIEEKRQFDENRLEKLKIWQPNMLVIADRWAAREDLSEYRGLIEFCSTIDCEVVFIGQPPEVEIGGKSGPEFASFLRNSAAQNTNTVRQHHSEKVQAAETQLKQLCEEFSNCSLMATRDLFMSPSGRVKLVDAENVMYIDKDHLSYAGTVLAKERLIETFRRIDSAVQKGRKQ